MSWKIIISVLHKQWSIKYQLLISCMEKMIQLYFELVSWSDGFIILWETIPEGSGCMLNRSLAKGGISSMNVSIRLVTMNWTVHRTTSNVLDYDHKLVTSANTAIMVVSACFITAHCMRSVLCSSITSHSSTSPSTSYMIVRCVHC
jgi:hypothetical protein